LVEVLVALGIAMASLVSIWYILLLVQSQFSSLQTKIKSEVELNNMMFTVEHYLGMAVNLSQAAGPINNNTLFNSPNGAGEIVRYNLANWTPSNGSGTIDTLAYFLRENLYSLYNAPLKPLTKVRFLPTGLFFQRPTVNKYGILYVNIPPSSAVQIIPSTEDYFFESLVDLQITDIHTFPYERGGITRNMIFSVTFVATQRHFLPTASNLPLKWCPPANMKNTPECAGSRPYFDLSKSFTIKIRNNVIGESKSQKAIGPTVGALVTYPPVENRVFGNIYFLRPSYPPGALKR
jgi:hypothetical protein